MIRPSRCCLLLVAVALPMGGCNKGPSQEVVAAHNLGYEALQKKDYPKAFDHFSRAVKLEPKYAPGYFCRAVVFAKTNQNSKAVEDYGRAIAASIEFKTLKASEEFKTLTTSYYNRAHIHLKTKNYDEAIKDFEKVLELDPWHDTASMFVGIAYLDQGLYDKAIEAFDLAIDSNADSSRSYYCRGLCFYEKCHLTGTDGGPSNERERTSYYDNAERDFSSAIFYAKKPYEEAYCRRGWIHFENGNYQAAEVDTDQAIKHDPTLADAW